MDALFTASVTGKTQAGGAVEINMKQKFGGSVPKKFWQVQIVPSATPAVGTMAIAIKSPGSSAYAALTTTIDLTGTELLASFEAAVEAIKLTPTGFDADKTYAAYISAI